MGLLGIQCACVQVMPLDFRPGNFISFHMLREMLPKFSLTSTSFAIVLNARRFNPRIYMGCLGGPDPEELLGDSIIHLVLIDPTPERQLLVVGFVSPMCRPISDAKVL